MARICAVCNKKPQVVNIVSHANNKVKKWVYPNVHRMRFQYARDTSGKVYRDRVCTKCLKARKVAKVV